ncbi:MAG: dTDP-glucose 4,6-dehydratase [Chloroflexota bacterium]|nr:dTDP-glucose 4,6-dehydratase [Chloroflexota bacterium]
MRLLVTGGAGFIGSAFVRRRLAATSDSIVVLDKLTYAGNRENLEAVERDPRYEQRFRFVQGDIADARLVGELMGEVEGVVNFAAETHVDRSILDPAAFLRTDVMGVHTLLEACRQLSDRAGNIRFLQVSTDEVYGSVESGACREEDAIAPRSPYAAAKAAGELLARAYHETYGLDTVVTRGSNTYGPYQHPEKLVPLFVTNALDTQPLPLYGDGLQRRDWLYVDDHADAVGFVFDQAPSGGVYNVTAGEERANREVTDAILARLGKPWSLVRQVADRPGHDRRYAMNGSRLAALGWRPAVGFEEGMARTVDWFVANERWWRQLKDRDWERYYDRQYGRRLAESVPA